MSIFRFCFFKNAITVFFSLIVTNVYGNNVKGFKKISSGITIHALYETQTDSTNLDRFFTNLIKKLDRKDTSIKVLILLNYSALNKPDSLQWSASLGFDTVRPVDLQFIQDYYEYRTGKLNKVPGLNKPASIKYRYDLPEPIDISSSYDSGYGQIGLKLMYQNEFTFINKDFDRLYSFVKYGLENIESIKGRQYRNIGEISFFPFKVSYLSISPIEMRTIAIHHIRVDLKKPKKSRQKNMVTVKEIELVPIPEK